MEKSSIVSSESGSIPCKEGRGSGRRHIIPGRYCAISSKNSIVIVKFLKENMYSVKVNGKLVAKDKPLPVDYKYLAPVPQVGEYTVVTVTPDDYSGYLDLVDSQC